MPNSKKTKSAPKKPAPKTPSERKPKSNFVPPKDPKERAYFMSMKALCVRDVPDGEFWARLVRDYLLPLVNKQLRGLFLKQFEAHFGHKWTTDSVKSAAEFKSKFPGVVESLVEDMPAAFQSGRLHLLDVTALNRLLHAPSFATDAQLVKVRNKMNHLPECRPQLDAATLNAFVALVADPQTRVRKIVDYWLAEKRKRSSESSVASTASTVSKSSTSSTPSTRTTTPRKT